ncbi:MAG: hypothetical protein KatS3mg038_0532 [Candidatus Kapaibacterium sp.]|nr:MAG: hypothetical protein KatS3mg038_0532 [Candidatus Kapabacteria bacterium]
MPMEDDALHVGSLLRAKRTELGLSVSDISRLTGIRPAIIEAIEAGSLDVMPPVYMRSFLRRYARALGLDERSLPFSSVEPHPLTSRRTTTPPAASSQRKPNTALAVVIALGVLGAAGYLLYRSTESSNQPRPNLEQAEAPAETIRTAPSRGLLEYFGATTSDSMRLEAVATDTVWISVTMDGRRSEQVTLRPGERRQWYALQAIILSIGNAGGVELYRNGEPLPALGHRGEAVRYVKITPTEVIPSTSSWTRKRDSVLETLSKRPTATTPLSPPPAASSPLSATPVQRSPQANQERPPTRTTQQTRRQELLRRAQRQQEITPVAPKAPLPTPNNKPSSP